MKKPLGISLLLGAVMMTAGCRRGVDYNARMEQVPTEARGIWNNRCVACHGNGGQGDGPGAAALNPRPRSFRDQSWQSSTSDDHIRRIIVSGGAAAGRSPMMPPNPDLESRASVVDGLVQAVRVFRD